MSKEKKLYEIFWSHNTRYFGGILPLIPVVFSGRLKTTGGQYFKKPKRQIQISPRYFDLKKEEGLAWKEIEDTLGHEMVHYYLDFLGKPCGHTPEFYRKLKSCGFSRYSRLTPIAARYVYSCPSCKLKYYRRKLGVWSCGPCSGKVFDRRFKLELDEQTATELQKEKKKNPNLLEKYLRWAAGRNVP